MAKPARAAARRASATGVSGARGGPHVESPRGESVPIGATVDGSPARLYNGKLLMARQARKLVEQDEMLLRNRIALLKQEEQKVWSKIDRTKKKAGEIMGMRMKNEEKMAVRQAEEERAAATDEKAMQNYEETKAKMDAVRMKRLVAAANERKRRVLDLKAAKEAARQRIEEEKQAAHLEAKAKAAALRLELERARKKRELLESERVRKNREEYESRVAAEEERKAAKEEEVRRLESLEVKLIGKLRDAQELQQAAYSELEEALSGPL
uniref:Uncharacterized protein n=1 Tax=Bicosoecida sp. CB-2014 TaxID=1486930 RepID=A0A7S1G6U0_9STRA|mmetsp:Transcript_18780/g.66322  ORF Transcript_18780/g.66322 Transcript_18780/m.66322 type:complete len:268 (+) Transcript_18780:225-1028(+)